MSVDVAALRQEGKDQNAGNGCVLGTHERLRHMATSCGADLRLNICEPSGRSMPPVAEDGPPPAAAEQVDVRAHIRDLSMYRSAYVSPWKADDNKRGCPTPRHTPLRELRKGTDLLFGCDRGDTMAAPLFDPERLSHACGTMQSAVSFYLFPVICAVQQLVLIDRRGLERDHH